MVDNREAIETFGKVWDSLSTGMRFNLCIAAGLLLLAVGGGAFGGGFWLGNYVVEARFERQVAAMEREIASLKQQSPKELGVEISIRPPLDMLPTLAEAPLDSATLPAFAERYRNHLKAYEGKTSIQTPDFNAMHVGKRFVWSGWIENVYNAGGGELAVRLAEESFDVLKHPFSTECLFEESHEILEKLEPGTWIEVTGVMDVSGHLRRCKLLQVREEGLKPQKPSDWKTG